MHALDALLRKAYEAGIPSNTVSISQQLQLSAVLAAMTADLQAETAAIAVGSWETVSGDAIGSQCAAADALQLRFAAVMQFRCLLLVFWEAGGLSGGQGPLISWMRGSNGHAVPIMQLITSGLQYVSSIMQHVAPAVRVRRERCGEPPQLAAALTHNLQCSSQLAGAMCIQLKTILMSLITRSQSPPQQQGQGSEAGEWQQLLLSPHVLPCLAGMLVMLASHMSRSVGTHCAREGSSSRSSSSIPQPRQQQQYGPGSSSVGGGGSGGSNSSGGDVSQTLTACQLQLLQLLGLAPEVANWAVHVMDFEVLYQQLESALLVCGACCAASSHLLHSSGTGSGVPDEQQQQHRWQYEQQLWQLLPTVLLPCASSLLLPGAPHPTQAQGESLTQQLLVLGKMTAQQSTQLQLHLRTLGVPSEPTLHAWPQEYMGVLLQLADRLFQQPRTPADADAAAAPGSRGNSTSSASTSRSPPAMMASCAVQLLQMLSDAACDCRANCCNPSSNCNCNSHSGSNGAAAAGCSSRAAADSPLTANFIAFVRAAEATVRTAFQAVQRCDQHKYECGAVQSRQQSVFTCVAAA